MKILLPSPRRNSRRAVVVQLEFLRVCEFTSRRSAFLFDVRGAERGKARRSLNLYRAAYIACSRLTELQIRSTFSSDVTCESSASS